MAERTCTIDGCERPLIARGWCHTHYKRWQTHGTTDDPKRLSTEERFWAKVDRNGPMCERLGTRCWIWTAATQGGGYGLFVLSGSGAARTAVYVRAHLYAYEQMHGQIPDGGYADHRCFVKPCVNPAHIRIVTNKQNIENRQGANRNSRTGVRGVTWDSKRQRWIARICHEGKHMNIGRFGTLAEAEAAVIAKRLQLFTHSDGR